MRKNTLKVLLVALTTTVFFGCGGGEKSKIDYIPFKTDRDGMWGMIDREGNILFEEEFKSTPSVCREGVFAVQEEESVTLYLAEKKPVAIKGCEDLLDAGMMSDGLIPIVRKGERIKFINKSGKEKFELKPHKSKEITFASNFTDGFATIVNEEGKSGIINTSGKVIIEPVYSQIFHMGDDIFFAEKDSSCLLIDKSGKTIKKLKSETYPISVFVEGKALFTHRFDGGRETLILDTKGERIKRISDEAKDQITSIFEGGYIYEKEGSYGVKSFDDEIIIRAKYETIIPYNGKFFVEKGEDTWTLLDEKGEELKEFEDYEGIGILEDWILGEIDGDRFVILNENGEPVNKEDYYFGYRSHDKVKSDYCDVEGFATALTEGLNDKGFGKIALGTSASAYLSDEPAKYSSRRDVVLDSTLYSKNGLKYKAGCSIEIQADTYIATYEYDYFTSQGTYSFNPEAEIQRIVSSTNLSKDYHAESVYEAAVKQITSKGFKSVAIPEYDGKHAKLFSKGNILVFTYCTKSGDISIFITKNEGELLQLLAEAANNVEESWSVDN